MIQININSKATDWQEYRTVLYLFILKRVRNQEATEDIVQKVLLTAIEKQGTLKKPSNMRPWLYQITRNAIIDYYRLQKPSAAVPEDLFYEDNIVEDNSAQRELARCLIPLLKSLPEPYRQALELIELEGVKQREAAAKLGLSLSGAKSRIQRGRKMLREVLEQCCRVQLDRRGGAVDYEVGEGCDRCSKPSGK